VSVAVTWRFCLRPMRNGQRCIGGSNVGQDAAVADARAAEIARLREQVQILSLAQATSSGAIASDR
jgi:hypothetical protein